LSSNAGENETIEVLLLTRLPQPTCPPWVEKISGKSLSDPLLRWAQLGLPEIFPLKIFSYNFDREQ
jgi:hypothetical protein